MSVREFLKIFNEIYSDNTDEFTISTIYEDNELLYDIEQSLVSKKLFLKNIFYGNPNLVFFISLFNTYQNLISETFDKYPEYLKYSCYTHAFIVHILKVLEQNNLIKIISLKKENRINLDGYYEAIGNNRKHRYVQMYIVNFQKMRNFVKKDLGLIRDLLNLLKIDENQIHFYQNMDDEIQVGVKNYVYLKNLYTGIIFKQLKKEIDIIENYTNEQVLERTQKK